MLVSLFAVDILTEKMRFRTSSQEERDLIFMCHVFKIEFTYSVPPMILPSSMTIILSARCASV